MLLTSIVKKIKTHFIFNNFLVFENHAVFWDNVENIVESDRPQMTIWHMRISCWILKATDAHSACVILITFPLQQRLQENTLILSDMSIACHVLVYIFYRKKFKINIYFSWNRRFLVQFRRVSIPTHPVLNCSFPTVRPLVRMWHLEKSRREFHEM
jgi:hypothetical protein